MSSLFIIPIIGVVALLYTFWFSKWVANREVGTDRMKRIAGYITEGAMAFLKAEYLCSMSANLSKFDVIGIGDTDLDLASNGDFVKF